MERAAPISAGESKFRLVLDSKSTCISAVLYAARRFFRRCVRAALYLFKYLRGSALQVLDL
eukprot:SAG31_NODE_919_length_11010_cov_27.449821_13_plen_61_part_00